MVLISGTGYTDAVLWIISTVASIARTSYTSNSETVILISVAIVATMVFFTLSIFWFFLEKEKLF